MSGSLLHAVMFALAYFAGSELGYALSLGPSVGGTFWPPAGISLAVLLASPTRSWPLLVAAGALANFASDIVHGQMFPAAIGFAFANLGEPLLGALLLRRLFTTPITFTRLQEAIGVAAVVVFSQALSSARVTLVAHVRVRRAAAATAARGHRPVQPRRVLRAARDA